MNIKNPASRQEVLDAAAECFMAFGADATSIDDIARHMGATKGRIYHHFRSKGMLHGEVVYNSVKLIRNAVDPVLQQDLPPDQRIAAMSHAHIVEIFRTLPYHKVVVQTFLGISSKFTSEHERALFAELKEKRNDYENLFRRTIQDGMDSGQFRQGDLTVSLHGLLLLINSPCFWFERKSDIPAGYPETVAARLSQMAVASLV